MLTFPLLNNKKTIEIDGIGESIFNLLQKTFVIPKDFEYQLIMVTGDYVARPDLLSLHLYDTENYADILCKLNGVSNPFELNEGMYILAPSIVDIPLFYKEIDDGDNSSVSDKSNTNESVINMQKKKNETRKANEQIIGNSNFRIDKSNKIVIY